MASMHLNSFRTRHSINGFHLLSRHLFSIPNSNSSSPLKLIAPHPSRIILGRQYSDLPPPSDSIISSSSSSSSSSSVRPSPPPRASSISPSLKETELIKFAAIADSWWDAEGPFKPLHVMNPTRLAFIRSTLCRHFGKDPYCTRPFEGLKFVDVGCGGGILSEPLARMGASVTGIDAVEENIKIAGLHAELDPVTSRIEYRYATAEKLVEEQRKFDAVLALEMK